MNEEEEFELESSDYSEWDLVTQSKSREEGDSRVLSLFDSMTLSKFCAKCHIAAKEIVCFQSFLMSHFKHPNSSPAKNSCRNRKTSLSAFVLYTVCTRTLLRN